MTAKQALLLHALREFTDGPLPLACWTSNQVAARMTAITLMADPERARTFDNYDVVTIGKQLARQGLVKVRGVKYGPKGWTLTEEGAAAAAALPAEPCMVFSLEQVEPGDRLRWRSTGKIESGLVWTDPDGRAGKVMVEVDSLGGELMAVAFDTDGGLWKVGR